MGTALQVLVVYLLPFVAFTLWFYWSTPESRAEVGLRALALLAAFYFIGKLGFVVRYGVYLPAAASAGVVLGAVTTIPRLGELPLIGDGNGLVRIVGLGIVAVGLFIATTTLSASSRDAEGQPAHLAFPLKQGNYLVTGAGSGLGSLDAHGAAQRYGVDLVKVDDLGFRASSLWPIEAEAFKIWDDVITAPCDGLVLAAEDDRPDLPPSQVDSTSPLGNFVALGCPEVTVVLGHLKRASQKVPKNGSIRVGEELARVGASGNAGEAKLRVYALKGRESAIPRLLGQATPVPISFGEGILARGDRILR